MAKTIPQLTDATTVNAADELIIQQGGITKRATGAELAKGLNTINGAVNVKDFGAVGDGATDDTAAISAAVAAASGGLHFPSGTFVFNGSLTALFALRLSGAGLIRVGNYNYPAQRKTAINHLWAGEMRSWPMGNAASVSSVQRTHIPAGATVARAGFATGAAATHVNGDYSEDAIRLQRTVSNTSTAEAVLVFSLTQEETKPLAGNNVVLQWNGSKSATYTGGALTYKIQWSEEPQQPILNADGTYSNGNETAASGTFTVETSARNPNTPFWATALIPADATQVSVVFNVPFVGTAGSDDYVDIESVSLSVGNQPSEILAEPTQSIIVKAATRYQTSYPVDFPRGTATRQGSVQAVAINANTSYSFAIPVRFAPTMAVAPQFLFQSPTSGTESRLLNVTADTTVNGLAFNISENGTTITNNGAITANDQVLCQWTANSQL